jgi:hypothetical protein
MSDLKIAKEILEKDNLTLAIVKDGECFFKSKERGIKPLYTALMNHEEKLDGASAADKIVGKGAALLYVRGKIENLFAKVISKNSLEVLENVNIYIEKEKLVPYIKNRDLTGMCPIETMAEEDGNIDSLLIRIESFLKNNNLI